MLWAPTNRISMMEVEAVPQKSNVACLLFLENLSRRQCRVFVTTKIKIECLKYVMGTHQPDAGSLNLECAPLLPRKRRPSNPVVAGRIGY
jgi:hypothetical protein